MTTPQRFTITLTISLIFITTGVLKLLNNQLEVAQFIHYGYPLWFMYSTAIVNIIAAIGLLNKRTFLASVVALLLLLSTSIMSILLHHDSLILLVQPVVVSITLIILIFEHTSRDKKYLLQ